MTSNSAGLQPGSVPERRRAAEPGWAVPGLAGAGGRSPVLPRRRAEPGRAPGRAVTAGIHLSPRLTFLLDFSEHISGHKQLLRAARREAGSHLLCKCYT